MARLSFRCDDELVQRVDEARGMIPREAFMRAITEQALAGEGKAWIGSRAVEQALGDAEPRSRKLPAEGEPLDGRRSSSPAPAEQPVAEAIVRAAHMPRSSSQAKRDVRPIPKRKP